MITKGISKWFLANIVLVIIIVLVNIWSLPANVNAATLPGNWKLVWSDEFNSTDTPSYPNSANWGYENGYVRNKEWQYYTNELRNAYCQDGYLHIEAHKDAPGTYSIGSYPGQDGSISSASLISKNLFQYKYGVLEMRAKIDTDLGSWPAFWTLGVNGDWPDCGECDIMEYYQNKLLFNTAWWLKGDRRWTARWDSKPLNLTDLPIGWADGFHIWSMEWNEAQVRLYLDGQLYNTWDCSQDRADGTIQGFLQSHYIILNQAIGGTAGGDASGLTYPTDYEIDWVRLYQNGDHYASSETNKSGTVSSTYSSTGGSDNVYEAMIEVGAGGKPQSRYSIMNHTWKIDIGNCVNPQLSVEAYHNPNSDDDFVFAYSKDNINFTNTTLTVTKTTDDNIAQTAALSSGLSGIVYIRATDTSRAGGNISLDKLYVDKLWIHPADQ